MIYIIIPAYNAEKTIARCLESIFAQTYRDFEVIVVDDGSTDKTTEIMQSATKRRDASPLSGGQSVTLIQQENRGANAARNRGWEELRMSHNPPQPSLTLREGDSDRSPLRIRGDRGVTKYILFCDADIIIRPDCLEKMVRALEEHPKASYAYSSFKFGWKKFKLWPFSAERLRQMPYIHTTSLIRASVFHASPLGGGAPPPGDEAMQCPFDESIKRLQDWDLWLTMLEQGHTGIWIPEVLFRVINPKGTMSQWLPSFAYKIPKWLGLQPKAVARYNEAIARIKEKHHLQ